MNKIRFTFWDNNTKLAYTFYGQKIMAKSIKRNEVTSEEDAEKKLTIKLKKYLKQEVKKWH